MGTPALSSNWKLLQQKLAHDKKTSSKASANNANEDTAKSTKLKRKAANGVNIEQRDAKRHRPPPSVHTQTFSSLQRQKERQHRPPTMGAQTSTPSTPATTTQPNGEILPAPTSSAPAHLGKYIAIDTEMVGTTSPTPFSVPNASTRDWSIVARVSLVSYDLTPLYDAYVLPPPDTPVSDYRTQFSGITPWHLNPGNASTRPKRLEVVQKEVAALLEGRVLVGHALQGDLKVLGLSHPRALCRDTSRHPKYRMLAAPGAVGRRQGGEGRSSPGPSETTQARAKGKTPSLKRLAHDVLGWEIQGDAKAGHSSVEDAKATMALFKHDKVEFEREAAKRFGKGALGGARKQDVQESNGVLEGETRALEAVNSGEDDGEEEEEALDRNKSEAVDRSGETRQKKKKKKKGKYRR